MLVPFCCSIVCACSTSLYRRLCLFQFTLPSAVLDPVYSTICRTCSILLYRRLCLFHFNLPSAVLVPFYSTVGCACSILLYRQLCLFHFTLLSIVLGTGQQKMGYGCSTYYTVPRRRLSFHYRYRGLCREMSRVGTVIAISPSHPLFVSKRSQGNRTHATLW